MSTKLSFTKAEVGSIIDELVADGIVPTQDGVHGRLCIEDGRHPSKTTVARFIRECLLERMVSGGPDSKASPFIQVAARRLKLSPVDTDGWHRMASSIEVMAEEISMAVDSLKEHAAMIRATTDHKESRRIYRRFSTIIKDAKKKLVRPAMRMDG